MPHVREQIRKAVAATLVAANTNAGARVFTTRLQQITAADLPCLLVVTPEEPEIRRAFAGSSVPAKLERDVTIVVEAIAKHGADAEDAVDDLCAQVEAALHATRAAATLGGLVPKGLWPASFEAEEDQLEVRVYLGRMRWAGTYFVNSNAPTAAQ